MRQNLPNGQNRRFLGTIHQWQLYFIWSINLFLPNIYSFHFNCQSGGQYLNGKVGLDWMASQILIWEILIPVPSPPWHINHGTLGSGIIHWGPSLHWRPCLLCNWCSLLGTKLKGNIFGCFMIALGWKKIDLGWLLVLRQFIFRESRQCMGKLNMFPLLIRYSAVPDHYQEAGQWGGQIIITYQHYSSHQHSRPTLTSIHTDIETMFGKNTFSQ